MADLISAISSVFTAAIGWVGTVASTIAGEPILLLAFCGHKAFWVNLHPHVSLENS